jgi:hypothetical protein
MEIIIQPDSGGLPARNIRSINSPHGPAESELLSHCLPELSLTASQTLLAQLLE